MTSPAAGASIDARGWGWRHAGRMAWALDGLDLRIEPGERVLLLGASGAGKSTLIHALAGVLGGVEEGEEHGTLLVDGIDPRTERGRAGLVLQDPDSQVILARVGDDVAFGLENLGVPREEIWPRVREALEMTGMDLPLDYPTSQLSGGQKQRLALSGVLAMRPGLLLLDEPTANLDPGGVRDIHDAVARVLNASDATFVVIEHRVAVWKDLVDRVIVLEPRGGLLADGSPDDVLSALGPQLAASGVWVPSVAHRAPARHRQPSSESAVPLVHTESLAVARTKKVVVASDIDLSVCSGEILAITGPNGAGKSTLALTLAGLLRPAAGRVLAGEALSAAGEREPILWSSRDLLTRIGTVFQDPEHQFIAGTVRKELAVGPRAMNLPDSQVNARVDELLDRLHLGHLAEANPFTLSGGEKRRLSVATALASRPAVLVLDEPTFGQDFRTWQEIVALLAEIADEGTAIVAVSHDEEFVSALADRILPLTSAAERDQGGRVRR